MHCCCCCQVLPGCLPCWTAGVAAGGGAGGPAQQQQTCLGTCKAPTLADVHDGTKNYSQLSHHQQRSLLLPANVYATTPDMNIQSMPHMTAPAIDCEHHKILLMLRLMQLMQPVTALTSRIAEHHTLRTMSMAQLLLQTAAAQMHGRGCHTNAFEHADNDCAC